MKVILQQDVANLGQTGDVVKVKDGYGRNFLVPRGLAVIADERNVARLEHQTRMAAAKASKALGGAQELANKISETAVTIKVKAGEEGQLHGSVTNRDIAEALAAEGFDLDRRLIHLAEAIKNVGVFQVPVKLHRDVEAEIKVYVIQE